MKKLLFAVVLLAPQSGAVGQAGEIYLSNARQPVRVSMMAVYQRFVDEQTVSQVSAPLLLVLPISGNVGVSLQTSPATSSATDLDGIGGLSDARLSFSYFGRFGASSLGANLGLNLPSGKRQLTPEEFRTSVLLSQNMYDFRVPVLGQGFNAAPGVTVATPIAERIVVGFGFAYQYRGSFEPIDGGGTYDPGDEILVTGGLDAALDPDWRLSADVSFARYQTDTMDDVDRYRAGNKWIATAQLMRQGEVGVLRFLARYRTRSKGELPAAGEDDFVTEAERTVPDQGLLHASLRLETSDVAAITLLLQGRHYSETGAFPSASLVDVGAMPEYRLSTQWRLLSRFVYTLGDFSGFEGGVGLGATF